MCHSYIHIPESLFNDNSWKKLKGYSKDVFLRILVNVRYDLSESEREELKEVGIGQIKLAISEIGEKCGIKLTLNEMQRCIKDLEENGLISKREISNGIYLITIAHKDTFASLTL